MWKELDCKKPYSQRDSEFIRAAFSTTGVKRYED
jgi:hypothetical protein